MNSFYLKIIATDKVFYSGRCVSVTIPAMDGEKTIWAHHENIAIVIKMGVLRFKDKDDVWHDVIVGNGFIQVMNNRATVIVHSAERPEDIDIVKAREAKEVAEEELRQKQSIMEHQHSKASLARALTRLTYKERKHM